MKRINAMILFLLCTVPLLAQTEDVIYSFLTTNEKVMQFLLDETGCVFICRFLSQGTIELEVRDDLTDEEPVFTVHGYHRGGGIENAAMDYNDVHFSNDGYGYDVYYVWAAGENDSDEENDPIFGIKVRKDGEELADIEGKRILTGDLYGWSFHDLLPESPEGLW